MRFSVTTLHVYALVLLVVAALSGCTLLRKGVHKDYALSPETRPLEVPPDLNIPATSGEGKYCPKYLRYLRNRYQIQSQLKVVLPLLVTATRYLSTWVRRWSISQMSLSRAKRRP